MLTPAWVNAHSVGAFHDSAVSQKDVCKIFARLCFLLDQEDAICIVVLGWVEFEINEIVISKVL